MKKPEKRAKDFGNGAKLIDSCSPVGHLGNATLSVAGRYTAL
jgi:hypothetical protein